MLFQPKTQQSHQNNGAGPGPNNLRRKSFLSSSIKTSLSLAHHDHVRWRALGRCSIHLPAIAISVTLLSLNFSNTFYGDTGAANQNLGFNALQFVAKLHEVFIGASLSLVAINYIQFELLRGQGLSLSEILIGFQISELSLLWNPVLWQGCLTKGLRARRIQFILLIIVLVILGSIVGPSSAILMLPALGWWDYPNGPILLPFNVHDITSSSSTNGPRFFVPANQSTLWPTSITSANFLPSDCNFTSTTIPEHCPAGSLSFLLDKLAFPDESPPKGATVVNVTMAGDAGGGATYNQFITGSKLLAANDSMTSWLTQTTSIIVNNMLESFWDITFDYNEEARKYSLSLPDGSYPSAPQTLSVCESTELLADGSIWTTVNITGKELSFPTVDGNSWTADATPLLDLWNASNPDGWVGLWVKPPYQAENMSSIAAAFISLGNDSYTPGKVKFNIETCAIYAAWQPVKTYIVPNVDSYIHTSTNDDQFGTFPDPTATNGSYIELDLDWANSALPINNTVFPLFNITNKYEDFGHFGLSITMLITTAMSRLHIDDHAIVALKNDLNFYNGPNSSPDNVDYMHIGEIDPTNTTEFQVTVLRNGYSYSLQGITRRLAVGVIILHILIALIHTIIVVSYGWASPELQSLSDAFTLALNTPPDTTAAGKVGGDVRTKQNSFNVRVRELSGTQLGFVVGDCDKSEASSEGNTGVQSEDGVMLENMAN